MTDCGLDSDFPRVFPPQRLIACAVLRTSTSPGVRDLCTTSTSRVHISRISPGSEISVTPWHPRSRQHPSMRAHTVPRAILRAFAVLAPNVHPQLRCSETYRPTSCAQLAFLRSQLRSHAQLALSYEFLQSSTPVTRHTSRVPMLEPTSHVWTLALCHMHVVQSHSRRRLDLLPDLQGPDCARNLPTSHRFLFPIARRLA